MALSTRDRHRIPSAPAAALLRRSWIRVLFAVLLLAATAAHELAHLSGDACNSSPRHDCVVCREVGHGSIPDPAAAAWHVALPPEIRIAGAPDVASPLVPRSWRVDVARGPPA